MEEIEKLTVIQLRRNLDNVNLDKGGNKANLVERWYKHTTGGAFIDDEAKEGREEEEEEEDEEEEEEEIGSFTGTNGDEILNSNSNEPVSS